jgi:hypothetical protein
LFVNLIFLSHDEISPDAEAAEDVFLILSAGTNGNKHISLSFYKNFFFVFFLATWTVKVITRSKYSMYCTFFFKPFIE